MKSIEIRLTIERVKRGESHVSKYDTELRMDDRTDISDIISFTKDCKTIFQKAIAAAKDWENNAAVLPEVKMEVTSATYDGWGEPNVPLTQKSYNRWYIRDITDIYTGKGEESIYLVPDTRYTPEAWDLILMRDVLAGLSNV